jgi:class 3 adenylate cyclase
MDQPRVQYATTQDGIDIAFAETGEGYPLIFMQGPPFSHVERERDLENYRRYNRVMSRGRRLVRFDSRGSGLSQREIDGFTVEGLTADLFAVADRLELERFAICGIQAGGLIATKAAVQAPDRVSHIVFLDAYASAAQFLQIPQTRAFLAMAETDWEMFTETVAHSFFGWDAGQPAREYAEFLRECVDQETTVRFYADLRDVDLTSLLPEIKIPTLVIHHSRSLVPDLASARALASRLPDSELILLKGFWNDPLDDHAVVDGALSKLFGQEPAPSAAAAPASRTEPAPAAQKAGALVTILFTDIEGSTALTQRLGDVRAREVFREHERITREALQAHGGSEVKTMGDGFMASFNSASQALECARALQRAFARHNEAAETPINVRVGLNTGEPIAEEEDLFGTAVITASRIAAQAQGGEVLVSNVVRELVAGRGFLFADRGETVLRGFEDPVRVFELNWREEG